MEKHQDVIRQIILLLDTIEEGFVHMRSQIDNLDFESAHYLLNDCFLGVMSTQEAIKPIAYDIKTINQKLFLDLQDQLIECFKETVFCFTQGEKQAYKTMLERIISLFEFWREALLVDNLGDITKHCLKKVDSTVWHI